jgi:hypothetical protein
MIIGMKGDIATKIKAILAFSLKVFGLRSSVGSHNFLYISSQGEFSNARRGYGMRGGAYIGYCGVEKLRNSSK